MNTHLNDGKGAKDIWLYILRGGRFTVLELAEVFDKKIGTIGDQLRMMVISGHLIRYPRVRTDTIPRVRFGVTHDCTTPAGVSLRDLLNAVNGK